MTHKTHDGASKNKIHDGICLMVNVQGLFPLRFQYFPLRFLALKVIRDSGSDIYGNYTPKGLFEENYICKKLIYYTEHL